MEEVPDRAMIDKTPRTRQSPYSRERCCVKTHPSMSTSETNCGLSALAWTSQQIKQEG